MYLKKVAPNRRELRFFKKAKELSNRSVHYKAKIGAVIVLGNHVVAEGFNREKSHTRQYRYDRKMKYHGIYYKLHAEIAALVSSGQVDLTGSEIYVYRENSNGNLANCKPCVSCTQALKDAGVRHIYYTNNEGYFYEQF